MTATAVCAPIVEQAEYHTEKRDVSICLIEDGRGAGFVCKTSGYWKYVLRQHRQDAKKGSSPTNRFITDFKLSGKTPRVHLLAVVSADHANEAVAQWMQDLTDQGMALRNTPHRVRKAKVIQLPAPEPLPGREFVDRFRRKLPISILGRFRTEKSAERVHYTVSGKSLVGLYLYGQGGQTKLEALYAEGKLEINNSSDIEAPLLVRDTFCGDKDNDEYNSGYRIGGHRDFRKETGKDSALA